MKKFNHEPLILKDDIKRIIGPDGKRWYLTPNKNQYPSVTTVLSILSEEGLDKWRKRVGEEEAERIASYARKVGTPIHDLYERYLKNEEVEAESYLQQYMFNATKKELDKIDNIRAQEEYLYSDLLRMAGTVDLIGEYDGYKAIIDFKTSKKEKKIEYIHSYFLQATIYSIMLQEMTGEIYPWVVIILTTYDGECTVYRRHRNEFLKDVKDLYARYYNTGSKESN